jgi:hypothetical protein
VVDVTTKTRHLERRDKTKTMEDQAAKSSVSRVMKL